MPGPDIADLYAIFKKCRALPESQRATFLDFEVKEAGMRSEIERLLEIDSADESFPVAPVEFIAATLDQPFTERLGAVIGPYKLREHIGEGGFGTVYVAEQQQPVSRKVALKIIKPGMDTREVIARFEAERQALAMMDHPNIAKVLDAGATESGRPYFVMELVHGLPVTEFCDDQKHTNRQRLELFIDVCHAVQHAHQKGIIHRDLKPSNIMVTMHDDKPVPKVIDFGVSKALSGKLTEKTVYTAYGQMIGTPLYMSPEQAQMSGLDVDTRSDVYSLGVLLYELLTGTTPFEEETLKNAEFDELRRIIREDQPPRPSERISTFNAELLSTVSVRRKVDRRSLSQSLRGELDWIVMKALEKDRNRRYESTSAFAANVHRYLNDEPVQACPPSAAYRLRKFARRNKAAIVTTAVVVAALVMGMAGTTWQAVRATQAEGSAREEKRLTADERDRALKAEQRAEEQAAKAEAAAENERQQRTEAEQQRGLAEEQELLARRNLYAAHMNLALRAFDDRHIQRGTQLLDAHLPQLDREDVRGFEWYYLWEQWRNQSATLPDLGFFRAVAFSPDSQTLAVAANDDAKIKLWDVATRQVRRTLAGHQYRVYSLAFSPDGTLLASGSANMKQPGEVKLWNVDTGEEVAVFRGHTRGIHCITFSADGKTLASASSGGYPNKDLPGEVKLWNLDTLTELLTIGAHTKGVTSVAFSPNGTLLASGSWDGTIRFWDPANGTEIRRLDVASGASDPPNHHTNTLAFSPDGRTLADAGGSEAIFDYWYQRAIQWHRLGNDKDVQSLAVPNRRTKAPLGAVHAIIHSALEPTMPPQ